MFLASLENSFGMKSWGFLHRTLAWVSALAAAGCQPAFPPASIPTGMPAAPAGRYSIEQFINTTHYRGNSFSPDTSKILVSGDMDGVFNAFAIHTESGKRTRLTRSTNDSILTHGYFPHDERFLYAADRGGDELDHLFVGELDGTRTDLTPGEGHRAQFLGWAHAGRSLFLATNERDRRYFDAYEVDLDGYAKTLIYADDTGYELREVSPDERYLAMERTHTRDDTDVYVYDRHAAGASTLTPHAGRVVHRFQAFAPDGSGIYFTTNEGSEFAYLVRQDLETGARSVALKPAWDVTSAVFSHSGKYLVVGVNEDSKAGVRILDGATLAPLPPPPLADGSISSVAMSRDETKISFYLGASHTPKDLYTAEFDTRVARRLTWALAPEIDPRALVDSRLVRFNSYDGLEIPGLLFVPHEASIENKVPALVWVHGGPGGQARAEYSALIQYIVNQGFAVYAINHRGSSGYGKTFFKADDRRHGQADLDDCVASRRMLAATGIIDPERIGIIGHSYGGYIALSALSFRPDAFAVGVDMFGFSNWIRTLEMIPPWWEPLREALFAEIGDPRTDREYLASISPLHHAGKITRPLMVVQGENDPRVARSESDAIVAAVRARGVPVQYLIFPDEGHGLRKKENQLIAYEALLRFLSTHLRADARQPPQVAGDGPASP